ncbi:YifB family Mg chelatase-like AAA ATPase, partial [Cutibacterium granulosum]
MAGTMVEVEAATASGLPRTILVGLPDTSLYEARDRCRAAVASAGLSWPAQALTINLTPACLPKAGTHFDLAIAAAALAADEVIPTAMLSSTVLLGELGLDGRVRPVRGVLPALLAAREAGFHRAVVPRGQAAEARLVEGMAVTSVGHLSELIDVLHGRAPREEDADEPLTQPSTAGPSSAGRGDFSEVIGQLEARHAMEVAAAGRHHIVLRGAPGCGKSMLAARLPTILPPLDEKEALEVTAVHSLMGNGTVQELMTTPPLSEPHHSVSMAAMVGGGARVARPGAVSLAHRGVLFLDEAPEFPPRVLDALRGPLENGYVTICRSQAQTTYPARFQLVMALNPCPCGLADDRDGG